MAFCEPSSTVPGAPWNFDEESSKSGIAPHECYSLAKEILTLPNIKLRGLMMLPRQESSFPIQLQSFLRLAKLSQQLNSELKANLDTLSMGMSNDYLAAISAGSTMVRIGSAIFGNR